MKRYYNKILLAKNIIIQFSNIHRLKVFSINNNSQYQYSLIKIPKVKIIFINDLGFFLHDSMINSNIMM